MNEKDFKKGIEELKRIRMTRVEKRRMLESILSRPVKSPFMTRMPIFAFISSHQTRVVLAAFLIVTVSLGGITYASNDSLPGDVFYPIKVKVVEPVFNVINRAPDKKIEWEETKVTKRIHEAEKLQEENKLDEKNSETLERSIEESSRAFVRAVEDTEGDKVEDRKEEFRKKIRAKEEVRAEAIGESGTLESLEPQVESGVEKLRRKAIEAIDKEGPDPINSIL